MRINDWLYMVGSRQFGLSSRYDCHMYALRGERGILLVDSGSGMGHDAVIENLRREFDDLSRGTILITHKHPDHSCGAARLHRELGWPIATSSHTAPLLVSGDEIDCGLAEAQQMKSYPSEMRLDPVGVARVIEDGEVVEVEGFRLRAIRVRGHSADSFAYLFEHAGKQCLICADIIFYGGVIGLINTADSNMNGYKEDLPKLAGLAVDVLLPGHGLFTVSNGQIHIDAALKQIANGFIPRTIGQGDLIF